MKILNRIFPPIFILAFVFATVVFAQAQQPRRALRQERRQLTAEQRIDRRPKLLQALNLTTEQVQQIRRINLETREERRLVQQNLRQARRALDAAIYSETANQAEVEQRAREFTEAQSKAAMLRARTEFQIRQVLTPEQLARFKEMRARAAEQLLQQRREQRNQPNSQTVP